MICNQGDLDAYGTLPETLKYMMCRYVCTSFTFRQSQNHTPYPQRRNCWEMSSDMNSPNKVGSSRLRRIFALGLALSFGAAALDAETMTIAEASSYSPTSALIFNDARGSQSQKYVIPNTISRFLDHTPRNATVKMVFYWFDIMDDAKAVIRADSRGAKIQLVTDRKHAHTAAIKAIQSAFRHHKGTKSTLFYRDTTKRLMHAKFALFSQSGSAKNIAMWGSANLSKDNATKNGNDFRIRVNSPNYGCLDRAFTLLNDHKIKDVTRGITCTSKGLLTELTPVGGASPWTTKGINRIKCSGGTKVRAASMQWTDVSVAVAFRRKQGEGCDIQLLVSSSYNRISKRIFDALKKSTKHGRVKVFTAAPGYGIHYKFMAVQGNNQHWTLTGSLHPSKGSQHGVQLIVREDNKSLVKRYMKQFKKLTTDTRSDSRK